MLCDCATRMGMTPAADIREEAEKVFPGILKAAIEWWHRRDREAKTEMLFHYVIADRSHEPQDVRSASNICRLMRFTGMYSFT